MTPEQIRDRVIKYRALILAIGSTMETLEVSAEDGEIILLHMAGLSAGDRQQPISPEWTRPIAIAWAFAAEYGGGDS